MLTIECKGSPYEIGYQHGTAAKSQVHGSISFYASLFSKNCKQTWPQVLSHASKFEQKAKQTWPSYHEEMQGIADGAGVDLLDIVALNVRTEINFGLFSDGCTSLAWLTEKRAWLCQNWDWMNAQKPNLIITKITQPNKPTIQQITEAGIIGKIGFNSNGVGALFNAIRVLGVNSDHMPAHFGLRTVLESASAQEAAEALESFGMASSAHILIADPNTAIGLEFTKSTTARCKPDAAGRIIHSNHLLEDHPGEIDTIWIKDSLQRIPTMNANCEKLGAEPSWEDVSRLFEDEQNLPTAICRSETEKSGSGTLFNIVMDLKARKAFVRMGRPVNVEETIELVL